MKIAVSSNGTDMESAVDPRFGRAANFLIYDTDSKDFSVLKNQQNLQAAQGAGIQAGQLVINAGAEVVLTGNCGPKAFQVLSQSGISVCIGVSGKAGEVVSDFLAGNLKPADSPNVEGHWM